MKVAVFASGSGGNFLAAIECALTHPTLLKVALLVTDRPNIYAIEIAKKYSIPVIVGDFSKYCGEWKIAKLDKKDIENYKIKAIDFHNRILDRIISYERKNFSIDLVVLSYRRWIHGPLLEYFENRIINQHAGDLSKLDSHGERILVGINPVKMALEQGIINTRTSTFLVDEGHDTGEILCQGPEVEFSGTEVNKRSIVEHELLQKRHSDWPSLKFALKHIAQGDFAISKKYFHLDGRRHVIFKGQTLDYSGVKLEN